MTSFDQPAERQPFAGERQPFAGERRPFAAELPRGTVTFLFTDVEGSTRLLERDAAALAQALELHHSQLRQAVEAQSGVVFETAGDGAFAAFPRASGALAAVLEVQRRLQRPIGDGLPLLRLRAALHSGEVEVRSDGYFGAPLFRCARLLAIAHGGQTVVSRATHDLAHDSLPEGVQLRSLGSHRLRDLAVQEEVFQLVHPDLPADFPPLRSLDSLPHNLPLQLTTFVGRQEELARVDRLLRRGRLVTLTGAGGSGKTRLALEVAAGVAGRFPDGVWFVDLSMVSEPGQLAQQVAAVMAVREEPVRPLIETLRDSLHERVMLLVLDNCEQVLDEAARLIDVLLRGSPGLRVLATSREPLGIAGETAWRVPSLAAPNGSGHAAPDELLRYPAVQLFVDRAQTAMPSFDLSAANALAVARITRRVDGIPLALELAAARVRTIPLDQIVERLDDALNLLVGGSRTAPARQQTLRAAIDWSYDQLDEPERRLFARLSVFAGGWTLDAAEAIGGDLGSSAVAALSSLVDKSLAVLEETPAGGRYRYLEPIRDYARARLDELGEADRLRHAHLDYFAALAERVEPHLLGHEQARWFASTEREHDNLRAALAWAAASGRAEDGLRIAGSLWLSWWVNGRFSEGRRILEDLLPRLDASASARVRARSLVGAGFLATARTEFELGRRALEEGLSLSRSAGDTRSTAWALHGLGVLAAYQGDHRQQARYEREAVDLFRQIDDRTGLVPALGVLGLAELLAADAERALELLEEALPMGRQLGNAFGVNFLLMYLGLARGALARRRGDENLLRQSREALQESLLLSRQVGDRFHLALGLDVLAEHVAEGGRPEQAARLLGAAEEIRQAAETPVMPAVAEYRRHLSELLRATLGDELFERNRREGGRLSLDDALVVAQAADGADGAAALG